MLLLPALSQAKIVESIVAIVNDEIITLTDIDSFKKRLKTGAMVDDLLIQANQVNQVINDRRQLIDILIKERILDSAVKKQGLQITFERVEKEIQKISQQNGISREQLIEALKAQGVRFSDYQDFIKNRIERQSLIAQTITSKIKISEEEIIAYYVSKTGGEKRTSREVTVAHIFLKKNAENPDQPLEKGKIVLEKLKNGDSFEELAAQYSEDENFTDGGVLGTFKPGELVGPMDDEIRNLKVGETSKLVPTRRGYHILKVVKQKIIPDPGFESQKNQIRGILYQQAFKKQFDFWLEKKKQEAFIRINKA